MSNEIDYKWILFKLLHDTGKTKVYGCYNKEYGQLLGQIKWYGGFRKYSFFTEPGIIYEHQCLKDIASFLDRLMLERKIEKQNQK